MNPVQFQIRLALALAVLLFAAAQAQEIGAPAANRSAPSAVPLAKDDTVPFIDFPNTDIQQVLEFYETLTGKKVLFDSTVQGKVHVRVTAPVAKEEAIRILETAFALNSFVLIPGKGDIVRVIGTAKNARQFDIPIFSDVDQLPASGQVVSFLFKLDYADPQEVKTALDQVVAITPNITNIVALPKSQAVLVTESSDVIRTIVPVVAKLDARPVEVVSEFFPLQRADAKDVAETLDKMLDKDSQQNAPPSPGARGRSSPPEDTLIVGKFRVGADLRTNRVHIITRPVNLPFFRTVIAELDAGVPQGIPATRPLRFVLAEDVLDVVAGAIADPGVEIRKIENSGQKKHAATPVSNSTGDLSPNTASSGRSDQRGSGSGLGTFSAGRNAPQQDSAPEARVIRNTTLIADNRTNAIIVVGNDEMRRKVFQLLDRIDVRAPQVLLTAVIGELTLDDTEQFGVDYLLQKGNLRSLAASGTASLPWAVPAASASGLNLKNAIAAASLPSTGGGVTGLVGVSNSLDLFVTALESTGRFRVTSRPMIFTSNNRAAVISSGESIAVPSSINSSYGYGSGNSLVSTATVDYVDIALKLSVLPLINSDGEVTLQISQEDNNTNGNTIISGNSIPNVTTRSINTTVSVANEATIVLGGLVSEKKQITKSGIPVLHKMPLVGPLFGSKTTSTTRTELVVLIRPSVTNGPVQSVKATERAMEKTNFAPDLDATLDPPGIRVEKAVPVYAAPKIP